MDEPWKYYAKWKKSDTEGLRWFHLYEISRIGKSIETENKLSSHWRLVGGKNGEWLLMGTGFLWGMMKLFWNHTVVMVPYPCEYSKTHWIVHFKLVNLGLPWWRSGWSSCRCKGHRFDPWSGKIPHAAEQLSPCATTTEPACHSYWSPCT